MRRSGLASTSVGCCALLLLVTLILAGRSRAQPTVEPGPALAGVFFDPAGQQFGRPGIAPFSPFDFYVVAHGIAGGLQGYKFSVQPPAGIIISGGRRLPAGAIDAGVGDDNWIVDTAGQCLPTPDPTILVTYIAALFLTAVQFNTPICMGGAQPSRLADGSAGYVDCTPAAALRALGPAYPGCAVVNPIDPGCPPTLARITLEVGSAAAEVGSGVSLAIASTPFLIPCFSKDSWTIPYVTRIGLRVTWDAAVATLIGVRPVGPPPFGPTVTAAIDAGQAQLALDWAAEYCSPHFTGELLWLDFSTSSQPGTTAVELRDVEYVWLSPEDVNLRVVAGSIVTGAVADRAITFGAVKARWSGAR